MLHCKKMIFYFKPIVSSTNDDAKILFNRHGGCPVVVVAHRQTHGRGQYNRTWESDSEGGLYVSFAQRLIRDLVTPPHAFVTTVAHRVAAVMSQFSDVPIQVEWPNDLIVGYKKIGGILIESSSDKDSKYRQVVIGVGLNINHDRFPESIQHSATSLKLETGKRYDMGMILHHLSQELSQWP